MEKQAIIHSLSDNYRSFVRFIDALTPEEYAYRFQEKWTAGQQLEHIVLCMKPILQVFSMDKKGIEQIFGKTDRPGLSYESILNNYTEKLAAGGKAPERFVPASSLSLQKEVLCATLLTVVDELCVKIDTFSDEELDSLQIPHPLLGNLTLREMLYNTLYHVTHHRNMAEQHLANR